MRCEVVAIGTELLLGQIVDTNSSWIGEQLALAGIDSHFQVKVGDNFDRMEFCIRQGLERSDAVICCGGLGPTQDDITREVIARVMGVELRRDENVVAKIRRMFESRGRIMTDNNRRQADIPIGARIIPDMPGTAPGLICPVGEKVIYAVPGVPHEMREMMLGTILPDLRLRSGQLSVIRSRVLRTWGNSESGLAEQLDARIGELDALGTATLAFQASGIEGIKVRITVKEKDEETARRVLAAEELLVRDILGDVVFGVDEQTMETVVIDGLRESGKSLAVAEILTGGVMASRLTAINGVEDVLRGVRVYAGNSDFPGQPKAEDRAAMAARTTREEHNADIGIAAAAPEREEGHPRGTVFLHIATKSGDHATMATVPGDRNRYRNYAVISLLNYLRKAVLDGRQGRAA